MICFSRNLVRNGAMLHYSQMLNVCVYKYQRGLKVQKALVFLLHHW